MRYLAFHIVIILFVASCSKTSTNNQIPNPGPKFLKLDTVAGNGETYSGSNEIKIEDGPGRQAYLGEATGVAIDKNDNIYFTDWYKPGFGLIRKISPTYVVSTVYSVNGTTYNNSDLWNGGHLAIMNDSTLIIRDVGNNDNLTSAFKVLNVNTHLLKIVCNENQRALNCGFTYDSKSNKIFTIVASQIGRYDLNNCQFTSIADGPSKDVFPEQMATDGTSNFITYDTSILKITSTGAITRILSKHEPNVGDHFTGIAISPNGILYTLHFIAQGSELLKMNSDGSQVVNLGVYSGQNPSMLIMNSIGELFILGNGYIVKVKDI